MALNPLIPSPTPVDESTNQYDAIKDFLRMSFDNSTSTETAAVGPLQIAAAPEIFHTLPTGTSATVAADSRFVIDLNRPDSATWTVTSSNGIFSFSSDAKVREVPETPGVFQLMANTKVTIPDALISIPGTDDMQPSNIRFSGWDTELLEKSTFTLSNAAEQSLGLAA
jgi:hypothetical protein